MKFSEFFKNNEDFEQAKGYINNLEEFEKFMDGKELSFVPYSRFRDVNEQMKESKKNSEELSKKLERISKENITPEEFENRTRGLIEEHNKKLSEIEGKYMSLRKEYAVRDALARAGAKHPELLLHRIDTERLTEKDGKFEGIDEQIKTIRDSYSDMFAAQTTNTETTNTETNIYKGIKSTPINKGSELSRIFANTFWEGKNIPE